MGRLQPDPLVVIARWLREYGDIVSYRLGPVRVLVLGHPHDIASVLVGEHQSYMKDELTHDLELFLGQGLVTSEGAFWRRQRRLAAPSFTKKHIEGFGATMVNQAVAASERFGDDEIRDVHVDMMHLTLDIVLHTLFGSAQVPDSAAVDRLVAIMMEEYALSFLSWRRLLPRWLRRESLDRIDIARSRLDKILYGIIGERRERSDGSDLLGRLLQARDDDGAGMTDLQLRDEVATMFLAGHETTALALSYAFFLLAVHPDKQAALHREVDRVLTGGPARLEVLGDLPYTEAVLREAMRLYPPVYAVGREPIEDRDVGGYIISNGTQVLLPQWVVHRDPRWFRHPAGFVPERWLDGLAERLPRFAYFPFGGGARICVGSHFAMLEAVLALATLVARLEFEPVPGFELKFMPSVTLRPRDGVRLRVRRRAAGGHRA